MHVNAATTKSAAMDFRKLLQEERRRARQQQQQKVDKAGNSLDEASSLAETGDRASGAEEWAEQPLTPWSQR
jgi:TorA maturation chaperone TorD